VTVDEAWRVLHSALNVYGNARVDAVLAADPEVREAWDVINAHRQRLERDRRIADALDGEVGVCIADDASAYLQSLDLDGNEADTS
jgi:hypothetical protein